MPRTGTDQPDCETSTLPVYIRLSGFNNDIIKGLPVMNLVTDCDAEAISTNYSCTRCNKWQ
jgi:hypothetical protein